MPIKQLTPKSEIKNCVLPQFYKIRTQIVMRLAQIGEECVKSARNDGDYKDRTGNLRSSIGYIIIDEGNPVFLSGFGNITEGAAEGQKFANELATRHNTGTVLCVVAGMNYAVYVAAKGRNVIDSSELIAEQLMKQLLDSFK